jgi:orotate phosphoribosyltransferase
MEKSELAAKVKQAAYLEGDFLLRSGKRSKYYLDKYLFSSQPGILAEMGRLFAERIEAIGGADLIAGPELGAVALAAATSMASGMPFAIVRKASKDYATGKLIEGPDVAGKKVALVEDIGTTAGAALAAAKVLRDAGAEVVAMIFAIDRMEGARRNVEAAGLRFEAILTKEDLGI